MQPTVDTSEPTVEGILIRHPDTGRQVVTLMNWAYGITAVREIHSDRRTAEKPVAANLPVQNLTLTLRGAGNVSRVRSVTLEQDLQMQAAVDGASVVITMPASRTFSPSRVLSARRATVRRK